MVPVYFEIWNCVGYLFVCWEYSITKTKLGFSLDYCGLNLDYSITTSAVVTSFLDFDYIDDKDDQYDNDDSGGLGLAQRVGAEKWETVMKVEKVMEKVEV